MNMTDDPTPDEEAAATRRHDDAVQRGTQLVRRRRRVTGALIGACLLAITGVVALTRPADTQSTKVDVVSPPQPSTSTTSTSIAVTAPLESSTTTTSPADVAGTPTEPSTTTSTTAATEPTSTTESTPTTQPPPPPTGPGTANLTYSGVLSGQLVDAVSFCYPRPNTASEIRVNGTLNGTPWVLFVQSYDGEAGVFQVLTGEAGGVTGMVGQGYGAAATYPASLDGVSQIDWAHGATLNVRLTSRDGQTPAGTVQVQGTITCDG